MTAPDNPTDTPLAESSDSVQPTQSTPSDDGPNQNPERDPDQWVTGDEEPTGPQLSYLSTLAQEAGVEVPEGLTKASASKLIDDLQDKTGRGQ